MRSALDVLGIEAEVISLDPSSLEEVLGDILTIGKATGTELRAVEVIDDLDRRLDRVRDRVEGATRPRTFALEWGDPPYNGGHWVPEMIELAGGEALIASRGVPSVRITWEEIAEADPEVVVFMPCGYGLESASAEAVGLLERPELAGARAFYAVAANSFFSRPGPRLVDGVEALASVLHEECDFGAKPEAIREVAVSADALARATTSDPSTPAAELVPLEAWDGPWTADDPNANFKADVALYAKVDAMTTIRGLAESVGLPVGALVHYVLARYATTGSGALLELGPTMVHRLWEPIARAEDAADDDVRLAAYGELRELLSWLRAPLVDPALAESAYRSGGSLPPVED